jgi:hypothetical protein
MLDTFEKEGFVDCRTLPKHSSLGLPDSDFYTSDPVGCIMFPEACRFPSLLFKI